MRASNPSQPTTEEHRPPSAGDAGHGRPVLLAAFPTQAAIPIPASGEVVGREWLAKAGVVDTEVSVRHLRFFRVGSRLQIEDTDSRNGIYINSLPIRAGQRVGLDDGDVLRVGRTLMVYREAFTGNVSPAPPLGGLVGPWGLTSVREALEALAKRPDPNVLLQGETGTGQELLAEAVVKALGRDVKRLARINVAGIPASMFERHLFGSKKGAYTGALSDSPGVLRAHEGGAVFLDEIGELPLEVQPKILRLLDYREIQPVGEECSVQVEVALVAATNRPLEAMVEKGTFRRDLLARFLVRIELPPLRNRQEDVFAILQVLRERCVGAPFDPKTAEVEAVERLMLEAWPANVRALNRLAKPIDPGAPLTQHVVERVLGPRAAAAPQGDLIQPKDLPVREHEAQHEEAETEASPNSAAVPSPPAPQAQMVSGSGLDAQLQQYKAKVIEEALRQANWDQAEAARQLGVSLRTVTRTIKAFGLKPPKR